MNCSSLLKHDYFGHPIQFNYKTYDNTYNTKCGGAVSIIIKIFMTFFLGFRLWVLLQKQDDTISKSTTNLDLEEEGELYYNSTNMNLFWVLRDFRNGDEQPFYLNQTQNIFEIEFLHQDSSWDRPKEDRHRYLKLKAKQCDLEDLCKGFKECP